jgi:hypothetical protein
MPSSSVKLQQWQLHDDRWYLALNRNHQAIGHVSWDFITREGDETTDKVALSLKSGNVGIGASNPLAPLVVNTIYNMPSSSVKLQQWQLHDDSWYLALNRNHQAVGHVSWDFITREGDETTDKVALSLKSGNVGIGTNNPESKLHIQGGGYGSIIKISNTSTGKNWHMGATDNGWFTIAQTNIGDRIVVQQDTGNVGIGHMYPTHRLHVNGVARSDQANFETSSDRRVKKNIEPLKGSLKKIQKLQPVTFEYIDEYKEGKESLNGKQIGFIAQDVKKVSPEMVSTTSESFGDKTIEDFHLLNTSNLTPMVVDAIKELKAEVDTLKARINDLENKYE